MGRAWLTATLGSYQKQGETFIANEKKSRAKPKDSSKQTRFEDLFLFLVPEGFYASPITTADPRFYSKIKMVIKVEKDQQVEKLSETRQTKAKSKKIYQPSPEIQTTLKRRITKLKTLMNP